MPVRPKLEIFGNLHNNATGERRALSFTVTEAVARLHLASAQRRCRQKSEPASDERGESPQRIAGQERTQLSLGSVDATAHSLTLLAGVCTGERSRMHRIPIPRHCKLLHIQNHIRGSRPRSPNSHSPVQAKLNSFRSLHCSQACSRRRWEYKESPDHESISSFARSTARRWAAHERSNACAPAPDEDDF